MPKAHSTRSKSARKDPLSKPEEPKAYPKQTSPAPAKKATKKEPKKEPKTASKKAPTSASDDNDASNSPPPEKASKKDPKDSHLYTDDNPATTLHGTGFKDAETANNTLSLISARSLTYQFQTVNTLYHRASNHPSIKKAKSPSEGPAGIREALAIFKTWLDEIYPAAKTALRGNGGFKPLLSKKCVEKFLPAVEASGVDATFAKLYVELPKNRRLGNVLVDEGKPGEADWERKRYDILNAMVPEGKEEGKDWEESELWDGKGALSEMHLGLLAWGWSPVAERKLSAIDA